jgi:hypothetical protein
MLGPLKSAAAFEEAASFFHDSGDIYSELLATLEYVKCHLLAGNNSVAVAAATALKRFAFRETSPLVDAAIMDVYRAGLKGKSNAMLEDFLTTALATVKAAMEGSTAASPN